MKNKHTILAGIVGLLLIVPFFASALTVDEIQQQIQSLLTQLAVLQEQIKTLQSIPATVPDVAKSSCPALSRALGLGVSGSDVLSLQKFLVAQNLLSAEAATGSFEALTQGAVQRLQTKYGVVLSGTPGTTGYGAVGPRTRALIALNCNLPGTTSLSCPFAPPPTTACSTGWQANTDANGCTTSYKCSIPQTTVSLCPAYTFPGCSTGNYIPQSTGANGCPVPAHYDCTTNGFSAPTITSVDGPATLKSGERGTWTVRASTPNQQNASIKYSVTWGDEYMAYASSAMSAQAQQSITTSGTFTHAYPFVGAFSPRFTVSNDSGSASFTTSVQVSGDGFLGCPVYAQATKTQSEMLVQCPAGQHWESGKPTYDSRGCMIPGYGKCVSDICPAVVYQIPICPAGQHVEKRATPGACPAPSVCVSDSGVSMSLSSQANGEVYNAGDNVTFSWSVSGINTAEISNYKIGYALDPVDAGRSISNSIGQMFYMSDTDSLPGLSGTKILKAPNGGWWSGGTNTSDINSRYRAHVAIGKFDPSMCSPGTMLMSSEKTFAGSLAIAQPQYLATSIAPCNPYRIIAFADSASVFTIKQPRVTGTSVNNASAKTVTVTVMVIVPDGCKSFEVKWRDPQIGVSMPVSTYTPGGNCSSGQYSASFTQVFNYHSYGSFESVGGADLYYNNSFADSFNVGIPPR